MTVADYDANGRLNIYINAQQEVSGPTLSTFPLWLVSSSPEEYPQLVGKVFVDSDQASIAARANETRVRQVQQLYLQNRSSYDSKLAELEKYRGDHKLVDLAWNTLSLGSAFGGPAGVIGNAAIFTKPFLNLYDLAKESQFEKELKKIARQNKSVTAELLTRAGVSKSDLDQIRLLPAEQKLQYAENKFNQKVWSQLAGHPFSAAEKDQIQMAFVDSLLNIVRLDQQLGTSKLLHGQKSTQDLLVLLGKNQAHQTELIRKNAKALKDLGSVSAKILEEVTAIREEIAAQSADIKLQGQMTRFLVDQLYSTLSAKEKLKALEDGLYPKHIGEKATLQRLALFEELGAKVDTAAEVLIGAASALRQLGVKLPRDFEKGVLIGQGVVQLVGGIATKQPLAIVQGLKTLGSAFMKPGPNLENLRFQRLMDNHREVMHGIAQLTEIATETYKICIKTAESVNQIGQQMIQQHDQVMAKLDLMHVDILYQREIMVQEAEESIEALHHLATYLTEETYCFRRGLFLSHACAQRFFKDNIRQYRTAMEKMQHVLDITRTHHLLKVQGCYAFEDARGTADKTPGTYRHYHDTIWVSTFGVWQTMPASTKSVALTTFFDPIQYVDHLPLLTKTKAEFKEEMSKSRDLIYNSQTFSTLIATRALLKYGHYLLQFYSYDELIKNQQTGDLYSLNELLNPQRDKKAIEFRGIRLLENLLAYVHLAIAQQHLLSGGSLIPLAYELLLQHLSTPKLSEQTLSSEEEQRLTPLFTALNSNHTLHYNVMLYAIRHLLGISSDSPDLAARCLSYRYAFNQTIQPDRLKQLLSCDWEFIPKKKDNDPPWSVQVPIRVRGQDPLILRLPHPDVLIEGKLHYPQELLQLMQLKQAIVHELSIIGLTKTLAPNSPLRQVLLQGAMESI